MELKEKLVELRKNQGDRSWERRQRERKGRGRKTKKEK